MTYWKLAGGALAAWLLAGSVAFAAASCGSGPQGFPTWLQNYRQVAGKAGISASTIASAFNGVTYDARVIALDHHQGFFHQSFEHFAATRVTPARVQRAAAILRERAGLFQSIEKTYGVPGPILVAIWAMETDFGAGSGNSPTIRSLATLSYDCRRSDFFKNELLSALKIIDRGDLSAATMHGGWAGELGQTQFLPSSYIKYAVDFDHDGRRDLISSSADVLASTANYLKGYGWRAGGAWTPGSANYAVLHQWNKADVYCRTIAYFASKLTGSAGG